MTDVASERPPQEVADVIRGHGEAFLQKYGVHLRPEQKATLRALALCRTAALGGHVMRCLDCGHERIAYNSCRNRHCPKCQALSRAKWLEREAKLLLPVEYHHVVFTLPQEVAELVTSAPTSDNARVVYNLLFAAASATLREVSANPKRLGAQIGVLAVLHTWGQNLHHHPHLHCFGPCFPLRFLVRPESRAAPRQQMEDFSDSAIFHRWMDLFWTLKEQEATDLLTAEEKGHLADFTTAYESLPWRPLESHPHISEVSDDDLSTLVPSATRLLESLERRTRPSAIQRMWRQALSILRFG
jgi:Transposase zinc-binding domain/Putative transposase